MPSKEGLTHSFFASASGFGMPTTTEVPFACYVPRFDDGFDWYVWDCFMCARKWAYLTYLLLFHLLRLTLNKQQYSVELTLHRRNKIRINHGKADSGYVVALAVGQLLIN
jgi:hypothetical protein